MLPPKRSTSFIRSANTSLERQQAITSDWLCVLHHQCGAPAHVSHGRPSPAPRPQLKRLKLSTEATAVRDGLHNRDLRPIVALLLGPDPSRYSPYAMNHDLGRVRLHGLIPRHAIFHRVSTKRSAPSGLFMRG